MLSVAGRIFASYFSMNEQTVVGYGMVADKRISIGDRLRYIPMGYFNKNNIGTITGIVTTTLGDVEGAAPVALVNIIGGFFNSIVLILFLLNSHKKIYCYSNKTSECSARISRIRVGIYSRYEYCKVVRL